MAKSPWALEREIAELHLKAAKLHEAGVTMANWSAELAKELEQTKRRNAKLDNLLKVLADWVEYGEVTRPKLTNAYFEFLKELEKGGNDAP
jgi:hypothetical protein